MCKQCFDFQNFKRFPLAGTAFLLVFLKCQDYYSMFHFKNKLGQLVHPFRKRRMNSTIEYVLTHLPGRFLKFMLLCQDMKTPVPYWKTLIKAH